MNLGEIFSFSDVVQDMNATEVALIFRPTSPIQVVRFGVLVTVDLTGTFSLEMNVRTHTAAGVTANAVGIGGISCDGTAHELGAVVFAEPTAGDTIIKPGDWVELDITDGSDAGDAIPFIHYQKMNWDITGPNADYSDAVRTNRLVNGSTAI